MAANVPAAPSTEAGPLSSFDRISKIVYLYRPSPSSPTAAASSPQLILVAGWMDAREPHLAKYTAKLQALYPASPIMLIRSFAYHFSTGGSAQLRGELSPAVPVMRSIQQSGGPAMLVLVFSNGGAATLCELSPLPPHVTVFDSAPGRFQYRRSVTAFTLGQRDCWRLVLAHARAALYWVRTWVFGQAGVLERTWRAHHVRAEGNAGEVGRVYVYSRADRLVDWRDVEEHAARAREGGFEEVRLEEFEGTAHVAHVRGDEGRYWGVVREAWDRAVAKGG